MGTTPARFVKCSGMLTRRRAYPTPRLFANSVRARRILRTMNIRVGLALFCLLLASGAAAQPPDPRRAATSRACQWLASQQQPNGAISLRGQILNPNVWETANTLIALMRCDASAYRAVIAKGFEFLDANWIGAVGCPNPLTGASARSIHCVGRTARPSAPTRRAAKGPGRTAQRLLFSVQEPDGGWKIGYPEWFRAM